MVKKNPRHKIGALLPVLFVFLLAACLQPANKVPRLEYVPQGSKDVSANFTVSGNSDMVIVSFEGGAFQDGVVAGDFSLRITGGDPVGINMPVMDSETQAVLPFDNLLSPGSYTLTIKAAAFSQSPGRITVKAVMGDGTWSTPTENTGFYRNPIYAISYGAGKYLAGGGGGNLAYSRDGDSWNSIPPGTAVTQSQFSQDGEVRSIAYGNGTFYAVGKNGRVSYSSDGQNWTGYTEEKFNDSGGYRSINAIIYGGGRFIAAGEKGIMWCMGDDGSWTWVAETRFGNDAIRALAWGRLASGENRYVAGGDGPSDNGKLCWSGDGISWTHSTNTDKKVNGLAFGGGYFVAVSDNGKIYRSGDGGANWTEEYAVPGGTGLLSVVYGSNTFIASGHNGVALVSKNAGDTWTPMPVSFSTNDQISCAAYAGGRFILAGNPYDAGGNSRMASVYIKPVVIPGPELPADISATFTLAAGDNQLTVTLTGGAFKELPTAADFDLSNAGFTGGTIERDRENSQAVVFKGITVTSVGGGKTITVKASALSAKADSATVTVQKNLAWTTVADTKFGASNIRGVAYGNGKYVAVGAGKIVMSSDGVTWTEVPSPASPNQWAESDDYVDFRGIAYGNGRFVAVGYWLNGDNGNGWGVAAVSTDGAVWTINGKILTSGTDSAQVYAVAWTGTNFVAAGRWGRAATSTDGTAWTQVQVQPFDYNDIYAIASGGGKVVIGGANGKLAFSTDNGSTWTWIANNFFGAGNAVRAIAVHNTTFIAAGDGGNMKTAAVGQIIAGTGSDGGNNWQGVDSNFGGTGILTLASGGGGGGGKIIAAGHNGKMSESANGSEWTALAVGTGFGQSGFTGDEQIACIVYGNGKFVAGGNAYNGNASKIAYSNQ